MADTANGMGGLVVPKVFEGLPVDLEILFGELDGTFPNHPADPIQEENLADLKKAVLASKADIGLAFDGDADRVLPRRRAGRRRCRARSPPPWWPGPCSRSIPARPCSTTSSARRSSPRPSSSYGGTAVRTRVGHSFIKQVMVDTGAVFGGEHSGHYYFRDNYRADSGLIAAMVVLEELSAAGVPLSELLAPYRQVRRLGRDQHRGATTPPPRSSRWPSTSPPRGSSCDRTDGLTVDFDDWWFNVRPSNTEPLLRLNVEARLARRMRPPHRGAPRRSWPRCPVAALPTAAEHRRTPTRPTTDHTTTDTRPTLGARRPMALDPLLLEVLACPEDKGPLLYFEDEDRLYNPRLHRSYEVRDGIPVMLVDEATTVDDAEHDRLMAKAEGQGRPEHAGRRARAT